MNKDKIFSVTPTALQRSAMEIYIKGEGRISLSESMRRAGYSIEVARTPSHLTNKVGWRILVEQYFSDETMLRAHERGLNAKRHEFIYKKVRTKNEEGTEKEEFKNISVEVDDMPVQLRALDMAYKVLEKYPKEKAPIQINTFSLADMAKLEDEIEEKVPDPM